MASNLTLSSIFSYIFKDLCLGLLKGLKDSLQGLYCIHVHYNCPAAENSSKNKTTNVAQRKSRLNDAYNKDVQLNVRHEIYKCCAYNGIAYGMSVFFFYYGVLNLLKLFMDLNLSENVAKELWQHGRPALTLLFDALWTVPLFLIFKVINVFWFQDIADGAYKQRHGRPQAFTLSGVGVQISDLVFSIVIEMLFLLQASLMSLIPHAWSATALSCIHLSLLNSLYAFEYFWCNKGWTFHKRISHIEANWPYFVGFGLPLSLVTFLLPSLLQSGFVYSVVFPMYIISANEATPPTPQTNSDLARPLRVFGIVVWLSSVVSRRLFATRTNPNRRIERTEAVR